MENNQPPCALLRPRTLDTEMPSSAESKHERDNHVHRQVMELTRMRIERDRAAKHANCAILKKRIHNQPTHPAQQAMSYY